MTTGQLIRDFRLKKGLTQEDLSESTGLSVRTIQRIEKDEVVARAFTLQNIADALDIEFNLLNNSIDDSTSESDVKEAKVWLPLLHLSGLFLFLLPPIIIWILKRDEIVKMREHGIDVINFQLSMWIIMVPCGILAFLLITIPVIIFMGFFSTVIIVMNTFKVINNQPYKYPMSIKFLKS